MENKPRKMRMYILVNKELEMSKGKVSAQTDHESAQYIYEHFYEPKIKEYMEEIWKQKN